MRIDKASHPGTYRALLAMDYDNGAVNRYEPEAVSYEIPERFVGVLHEIEAALSHLTDSELESFVCDPYDEDVMATRIHGAFAVASELLDAMFEGEGETSIRGSR